MKDPGSKDEYHDRDSCCRGILLTFCVLSVVSGFAVINYLQFREILILKDRVGTLESRAYTFTESAQPDLEPDNRSRRAVPADSLTGLITALVDQEVKVLESFCGNSSKICLPGPKGDAGLKGDTGIPGTQGTSGPGGPPGVKGHQGQYGVPGPPGLKGDSGLNGIAGQKGDMGAKGEKGDFGLRGIPGPKGAQGQYGAPGVPGFKGDQGPTGLPGPQGQKGDEGRPLPIDQQCCSSLSQPTMGGNGTAFIRAHVGDTVLLPCRPRGGFPAPTVTFIPDVDLTGRNRFTLSPAGMQIQGVALTDSGDYICTANNAMGSDQKIIRLEVIAQVAASIVPTNINVNEGDAISIECDVSGTPQPVVTWHHLRPDGTNVLDTSATAGVAGRSTIRILSAQAVDAGTYTCTAQNRFDRDEASTTVSVRSKPQILQAPLTQTAMEGSTVTLYCGVIGTPPITVSWTYPLTGSNPPLNARLAPDNSVQLAAVDSFNSGTYTCTATNAQGSTSANAVLTVQRGVTVRASPHLMPATAGSPVVNLQCSATGSPAPVVTWIKGGVNLNGNRKYLSLSGGNLIITSFDVTMDTGTYVCQGANQFGQSTDQATVYNDQGQLNCTVTFGDTQCSGTEVCGGKCPLNCLYTTNDLYGFQTYPAMSPICIAAKQTGTLASAAGVVIWQHVTQQTTFAATNKHGIQSNAHAATSDANTILPPTGISVPIVVPPIASTGPPTVAPPIASTGPPTVAPPIGSTAPPIVVPPIGSTVPPTVGPPIASTGPPTAVPPIASTGPPTAAPPIASTGPPTAAPPIASTGPPTVGPPIASTGPPTAAPPIASTGPPTAAPPIASTGPPTAVPPIASTGPPTAAPPIISTRPPTAAPPIASTGPPTVGPPITSTGPPTAAPPIASTGPPTATPPIASTGPPTVGPPIASTGPPTAVPPIASTGPPTAAPPIASTGPPTAVPPIASTGPPTAAPPIASTGPPTAAPPIASTGPPTAAPPIASTGPLVPPLG